MYVIVATVVRVLECLATSRNYCSLTVVAN